MSSWDQPFEEQLKYFKSKGLLLNPEAWDKIAAQAHARAFTVAKVANMDILKDIQAALDDSIAKGLTLNQFKKRLPTVMEKTGWLGKKAPYRLDNIYRTNLAESYNVGRYKQQMELVKQRPFWRYNAVMDARTRRQHAAMHGKVYRADNPIWATWYPPNGFRCRCFVRTLSAAQMKQAGLKLETDPPLVSGKPVTPDASWSRNAGKEGLDAWQPDFFNYTEYERKLLELALSQYTGEN